MHCDARLKAARRVGRSSEELHLRKQEASEVAIDPRDVRREEEDEDEDDDDDDDAYSVRPPVAPGPPRGRSAVGLAGSATPSLGDLNERAGGGGRAGQPGGGAGCPGCEGLPDHRCCP